MLEDPTDALLLTCAIFDPFNLGGIHPLSLLEQEHLPQNLAEFQAMEAKGNLSLDAATAQAIHSVHGFYAERQADYHNSSFAWKLYQIEQELWKMRQQLGLSDIILG